MARHAKFLAGLALIWFAVLAGLHAFWFEPMADGLRAPDSRFWGYGTEDVRTWLGALDPAEKAAFLRWHSGFLDLVFPWLLTVTLYVVLRDRLTQHPRFALLPRWMRISFPLAVVAPYGVFDLLENRLIAEMVAGQIPVDDASVGLASAYTIIKFAFVALSLAMIGLFHLAVRNQHKS